MVQREILAVFEGKQKGAITPKPERSHPPKLVSMHFMSTSICMNFLSQFYFLTPMDYSPWYEGKFWPFLKASKKELHVHLIYCHFSLFFFLSLSPAPSSPPLNLLIFTLSHTSLLINWTLPSSPNGIIRRYTLYIDFNNGTRTSIEVPGTEYEETRLSPYQLVTVQVSAWTSVGEGPTSDPVNATTDQYCEYYTVIYIIYTVHVSLYVHYIHCIALCGISSPLFFSY